MNRGSSVLRLQFACLLLFFAAIALAAKLFGLFLLSDPLGQSVLVNSDTLLPMHMAWDLAQNPAAWAEYQWPRVPSLFPDMVYFHAAQRLGLGWRQALLFYPFMMLGLLAASMACVISRIRGGRLPEAMALAAAAVLAAIASLAALGTVTGAAPWAMALLILAPVSHGNAFIMTVLAAATADLARTGSKPGLAATLLLCLVGTVNDLLFAALFIGPLTLGLLAHAMRQHAGDERTSPPRRQWPPFGVLVPGLQLIAACSLACAIGWACQSQLNLQPFSAGLLRNPINASAQLIADIPNVPWSVLAIAGTALLAVTAIKALTVNRALVTETPPRSTFLVTFAAAAAAASLLLLSVSYVDPFSWRYGMAAIWWPITIGLAFGERRFAWLAQLQTPVLTCAGLALTGATIGLSQTVHPGLLAWHSPLEKCLTDGQSGLGLRAGLATYWIARQTEASSDWQLQVRPISDDGQTLPWGDDPGLYRHDAQDPARPAVFNFIVLDPAADRAAIQTRYGTPSRTAWCQANPVWIYDRGLKPF